MGYIHLYLSAYKFIYVFTHVYIYIYTYIYNCIHNIYVVYGMGEVLQISQAQTAATGTELQSVPHGPGFHVAFHWKNDWLNSRLHLPEIT